MIHQERDVFLSLTQRHEVQVDEVDAVEEVFAEGLFVDHLTEVGIGGTHHTHISPSGHAVAQHFVGLVLEHTQEFHLTRQFQLTYLIEEDGAALCQFEASCAVVLGIGERTLLVSKHLALEQRRGDATKVHLHKWFPCPSALFVDELGNEFLARTRLTRNQHRRIGLCHTLGCGKNRKQGGRTTYDGRGT